MKNPMFRVLGALASALIVVAVFIPFINVGGNTANLWEQYRLVDSLYLPIMIIVFGLIGVIFFSLNVKTEFAYMSTGAILFFLVMKTIEFIEMDSFSALSIGYYFLLIGSILTGLMAFLINLKRKDKQVEVPIVTEEPVLDKIDKLYDNEETVSNDVNAVPIEPIQMSEVTNDVTPVNDVELNNPVTPVVSGYQTNPVPDMYNNLSYQNDFEQNSFNQVPVVETPSIPESTPVINNMGDYTTNNYINQAPVSQYRDQQVSINPVVHEFMNPSPNTNNVNANQSETDIFGQPLNK